MINQVLSTQRLRRCRVARDVCQAEMKSLILYVPINIPEMRSRRK